MSIAQELINSETFLKNAYAKLQEKGATMPEKKTLQNLAATIDSVSGAGITFVDYIESTGTQYINTGIALTSSNISTLKIIADFQYTKSESGSHFIFGYGMQFGVNWYNGDNLYGYFKNSNKNTSFTDGLTRHVYKQDGSTVYIDDVSTLSISSSSFSTGNVFLFGNKEDGGLCSGKMYSCQIYDNNILVRDFKPCKDSNGVYCLYDELTGQCFYNQGTGRFRGEGWKPSYIESTGTQYIDTGFKPNNNTSVEMKVLIPSSQDGKYVRFFEARNSISGVEGAFGILTFDDDNQLLQLRYDFTANLSNGQLAEETEYVIRTDKNKMYVNDELKITQTASTFQTNYNLYLFGFHIPTELSSNQGIYRLFYFKLYDGDTLIRDFVPALDEDGVACVYDKISETYFYNQGTGEFLYG